jgi:hypothetical protein
MNGAVTRLARNLLYLKSGVLQDSIEDPSKIENRPEAFREAVMRLLIELSMAREHEREVRGEAIDRLLGEYDKIGPIPDDLEGVNLEFIHEWLRRGSLTLFLLRLRLVGLNSESFGGFYFNADILIDNDAVETAAAALNAFLIGDFLQTFQSAASPADLADALVKTSEKVTELAEAMRDAMYNDLQATL